MDVVLFTLLAIGVVGLVIWVAVRQSRRTVENLTALAQRQGLQLREIGSSFFLSRHEVHGAHHGRGVRFWTFTTGSGKTRRHWVAVGVEPRQVGRFQFRLGPQGLFSRVAEWFGAKEITVGDAHFDAAWFVRTNAPEVFGAALVPEIRAKLMAARERGADEEFKLEEGWVCYAEQGDFSNEATVRKLESLLPVLNDLADVAEVCADAVMQ